MAHPVQVTLATLLIVATAVWVGGFVALVVVARAARRVLPAAQRVAFFRALGRTYGVVGGSALVLGLGTGAALAFTRPWRPATAAAIAVAVLLVATTVAGVAQARRITRLRRTALDRPDDRPLAERVRRTARAAALLRAVIGVLSLALVALGVLLAS